MQYLNCTVSIPSRGFTGLQGVVAHRKGGEKDVSIPSRGFTGLQVFLADLPRHHPRLFQSPLGVSRVCRGVIR